MQEVQKMQVQSLGGEDSPGVGNGSPLQYSCLENPTDRGAWWAIVHGVIKGWVRPKQLSTHAYKFRVWRTHIHSISHGVQIIQSTGLSCVLTVGIRKTPEANSRAQWSK